MSTLKVNTLEEATVGGATFFTAKAWVTFNGEGTVAINQSGNTSSITDVGTGKYTQNFTNVMSSSNYSMSGTAKSDGHATDYAAFSGGALNDFNTTGTTKVVTTTFNTSNIQNFGRDQAYVSLQTIE